MKYGKILVIVLLFLLVFSFVKFRASQPGDEQSPGQILDALQDLKAKYEAAKESGYDVSEIERLGMEAKAAIESKDYKRAIYLLKQASALLENLGAGDGEPKDNADNNGFYVHTGFTFHGQNLMAGTFDMKQYEERLAMLKDIGIKGIRVEVWWRAVEPEKGTWDFSKYSQICDSARKNNMKIILVPDFSRYPLWVEDKYKLRNIDGDYSSQALDLSSPQVREYYSAFLQNTKEALGNCGAGIATASVAITRYSDTIYPSYPEWGGNAKFQYWMYGDVAKEEYRNLFGKDVPEQFDSFDDPEYMQLMRWYVDRKLEWHVFAMQETKGVFGNCTIAGTGKVDVNDDNWKTPEGAYRLRFAPDGQRMYSEGVRVGCDGFITAFNGEENADEVDIYFERWGKANGKMMWGENVGGEREGNPVDPNDMADYIIRTGRSIIPLYWGDEYLFDSNNKQTATYYKLKDAVSALNGR